MGNRVTYAPGTFCWAGLATSEPASATVFYSRLFDWQSADLSAGAAGTYTLLRRGGSEVAILYRQTAQARAAGAPPHWTSFITVDDADVTAARAGELGGAAVFREPFDVLDAGRIAAIRDPTGAIVSLWQPRSRIGATLVNDVGAMCWNELVTTDVERAKSFFGALLGWEYDTDDDGYTTIRNAGRPNGGIRQQSELERDIEPNWLPYFTVASTDDAVRSAERQGGRTLTAPRRIPSGRAAVLADSQHAAFGIFQGDIDP
jgi:predicted enzyme related to lactoylglutathione lyase